MFRFGKNKTFRVEVHLRSGKTIVIAVEEDKDTTPDIIRNLACSSFKQGGCAGYFRLMGHVFCATQIEAVSVFPS